MGDSAGLIWSRCEDVTSCAAGGEQALLVRDSWSAVRLDEVSREIWQLLDRPRTTEVLIDLLMARYQVSRERCRIDLLAMLTELAEIGAVRFSNAPTQRSSLD